MWRSGLQSGSVFNTDFNNGHGQQYFLNGQVSRDMEWSNMNLQDFMPTWQWWVESEGTDRSEPGLGLRRKAGEGSPGRHHRLL